MLVEQLGNVSWALELCEHERSSDLPPIRNWGSDTVLLVGLQVVLEGEDDAAVQAMSRSAAHRLQRGIFTSPGAGAAGIWRGQAGQL